MSTTVWTSSALSSPGGCAALAEVTRVGRSMSAFCHLDKATDDFTLGYPWLGDGPALNGGEEKADVSLET